MAVTTEIKEYCAHNLVAMIMQDIREYFPRMTDVEIISEFTVSKTYSD